jgi:hypothetical protein
MKLVLQQLGTVWLIGIESNNREEVERQYYSLWNHGATSGGLHEMCDTFFYIVSDKERVEQYFINSSLHLILNKFPDAYKGFEGGAMTHARAKAKERYDSMIPERFIKETSWASQADVYELGKISAENPDGFEVTSSSMDKCRLAKQ